MNEERIRIRVTATGQTLDVVVLNKRLDRIEIVLGEAFIACDANWCPHAMARPTAAMQWCGKSPTSAAAKT
jgi:hypothetical protein